MRDYYYFGWNLIKNSVGSDFPLLDNKHCKTIKSLKIISQLIWLQCLAIGLNGENLTHEKIENPIFLLKLSIGKTKIFLNIKEVH